MNNMKAARFYGVGKPLKVESVPIPKIGEGEVLVNIKACGICGSDIHIVFEGITHTGYVPITLGHEPAGVITAIGPEVKNWGIGDRVTINPFLTCDKCINCLQGNSQICLSRRVIGIHTEGGLAEYMKIPEKNLIRLPDNIPFDQGGIAVDAVATPFHAIITKGALKVGEKIAIFGCGGLGIHGVQVAKVCGASLVIAVDINDVALERAKMVGADVIINSRNDNLTQKIKGFTDGMGVDLAVEFIGLRETIEKAIKCIRIGGRVVVVGLGPEEISLPPPINFVRTEFSLLGSYGSNLLDIQNVVNLIGNGKLDLSNSITEKFQLEDVNKGLDHLHKKIGNPVRIVIQME